MKGIPVDLKKEFKEFWLDGYYWARHNDGSRFIVLRQNDTWYCPGLSGSMVNFDTSQIVCPVKEVEN